MTIYTKNPPLTIKFESSVAGGGKTHSTCLKFKNNLSTSNLLYVAQTKVLLDETKIELEKIGLEPIVIVSKESSSNTTPSNVKKEIMEYLKNCTHTGNVLLITWSAFSALQYFHKEENWQVVVDEIPQLDSFYELDVFQHGSFLNHIDLHEISGNPDVSHVIVKSESTLKKLLQDSDDLSQKLRMFYNDLLNKNIDIFVDTNSFQNVQLNGQRAYFVTMLNPKLFKRSTIIGANLDFPGFTRHFLAWKNSLLQIVQEKLLPYDCDVLLDCKTFQ